MSDITDDMIKFVDASWVRAKVTAALKIRDDPRCSDATIKPSEAVAILLDAAADELKIMASGLRMSAAEHERVCSEQLRS